MNFKIKNSVIFLTLVIFFILYEFTFPLGGFVIPCYFVVCLLFLLYYIIKSPSAFLRRLNIFRKSKVGFCYCLFFAWIIVGIVVSIITKTFIPKSFLSNFLGNFFCSNLFPFLLPALALPFFVSYKKLCKYLIIIYFCIFLAGLIGFIASSLGISFIEDILRFFINRHTLLREEVRDFAQAFGSYRVASIFAEPSHFAAFIFISSPVIYSLCQTKIKIFKKPSIDFLIKKATLIMAILCFLGTQSPINILFMGIFLIFVFADRVRHIKIKNKGIIITTIFTVIITVFILISNILSLNGVDVSETFLSRIINVTETLTSITDLTQAEPSLATRIGNYTACFLIGWDHPIFGIGYGNINNAWSAKILSLQFPITDELYKYAVYGEGQSGGGSMFFKLVAETGFVGVVLFYIFLINLLLSSKKIEKFYTGLEHVLIKSLNVSLLLYISISIYTELLPVYWIYFGIVQSIILNTQAIKNKMQIQMQIQEKENSKDENSEKA